jgi:hypothetical protein
VAWLAVTAGLAYKGELVMGLIMDPFRDECFTAALGGGAFLNGHAITVGDAAVVSDAVVCTGYGSTGSAGPMLRGTYGFVGVCVFACCSFSARVSVVWRLPPAAPMMRTPAVVVGLQPSPNERNKRLLTIRQAPPAFRQVNQPRWTRASCRCSGGSARAFASC